MIDGKNETHLEYKSVINQFSKHNEDCIVGCFLNVKQNLKDPENAKYFT